MTARPAPAQYDLFTAPEPGPGQISAPLAGRTPPRFSDRDYQIRAVAAIVDGLAPGGRGQLRAACGTGKTRIAQWAAQRLVPRGGLVVITAPTVGLVAQTIAVWTEHHPDLAVLAVCSDPGVNDDSYGSTEDIDTLEPVTTDADVVDAWLRRPTTASLRLIVGTHQSSHVIGEGLQKADSAADLLVVDEAHRSAGAGDKHAALLHDDDILPAARRLYMTATARIMLGGEGGGAVLSMDDEDVFGPVLFNYPFSQAIEQGFLDDYRVAVIGVTRQEVLTLLRSDVDDPGHAAVHTAMVQAATARAAAELGLRRLLAFCPRVRDAERFALTFPDLLRSMPEHLRPSRPLTAEHISGKMRQQRRREILHLLDQPPGDGWTVVSNAKCLSEGIDVPNIDGVLFTAPKKSTIEIVQAVGRALRRNPEGTGTATIIIPILLPDTDTGGDFDGDFIDAGAFEVLWQVVRALRAHDDTFGTALDRSRANGAPVHGALDRVDFVMPEAFREPGFLEHLTIRLVKSATSTWWDHYGKLVAFHDERGHTDVPKDYLTPDRSRFALGTWMANNRAAYRQKRLAPERIEALEALGVQLHAGRHNASWEHAYEQVRAYHAEHGNLRPPGSLRVQGVHLSGWLTRQRKARADGTLSRDRIARLDALGMQWDKLVFTEAERLQQIREFHARNGRLPGSGDESALHYTLNKLRYRHAAGELDADTRAMLDALGMDWEVAAPLDWWEGYRHLLAFHAATGHARPTTVHVSEDGFPLGYWAHRTRRAHRDGHLTQAQLDVLAAVGFEMDPDAARWDRMYAGAAEFHARHGHLRPPSDHRVDGKKLTVWLSRQRKARGAGTLSDERIARLDAIGMAWRIVTTLDQRIDDLRAWHREHGRLPTQAESIRLQRTIPKLREAHAAGTLNPELVAELTAMGIDWNPAPARAAEPAQDTPAAVPVYLREDVWTRGLAAAARFRQRHGHLAVRPRDPRDPADADVDLRGWLAAVRKGRRSGALTAAHIAALDELDMVWDVPQALWDNAIAACAAFHAEHGHLRVPPAHTVRGIHGEPYRLVDWINKRRGDRDKLTDDQIAQLDALGMDWDPAQTRWNANLAALTRFHAEYGHLDVPDDYTSDHGVQLAPMINYYRVQHRRGTLAADRAAALDALGIDWNPLSRRIERMLAALRAHYDEHGHLLIPADLVDAQGNAVYPWLLLQRKRHADGVINPDLAAELDKLGMVWEKGASRWLRSMTRLRAYHAEHGHINVPRPGADTDEETARLHYLVAQNRAAYHKGKLPAAKIADLEALGIDWNPPDGHNEMWTASYAAAAAYHAEHGDLDVPPDYRSPTGLHLRQWVGYQRKSRAEGRLSADRVALLDAIGMDWTTVDDAREAAWNAAYERLLDYSRTVGPANDVPSGHRSPDGFGLGWWVTSQRRAAARGSLRPDRARRLAELGVGLRPRPRREPAPPRPRRTPTPLEKWTAELAALRAHHAQHGTVNIPRSHPSGLGKIVARLRAARRAGTLPADRIAALDALGIDWDPTATAATRGLEAARRYHARHGHLDPRGSYTDDTGYNLSTWLAARRQARNAGTLTDAEIAELDALGIVWDPYQAAWEDGLTAARAFHTANGHLRVPADHDAVDRHGRPLDLRGFLNRQRDRRRDDALAADRIAALDALGIDWNPALERWETHLRLLRAYRDEHGHLAIPDGHTAEGLDLSALLGRLRVARRAGTLPADRIAVLDTLGIDWDPNTSAWTQMIDFLRTHHAEHGHIRFPSDTRTPPGVAGRDGVDISDWFTRVRHRRDNGRLSAEHIAELDALGMNWERDADKKAQWWASYDLAVRWHARHGHLRVPTTRRGSSKERDALYSWLARQRTAYNNGTLAPDRIAALEKLDIDWQPLNGHDAKWLDHYDQAKDFHDQHGHLDFHLVANNSDTDPDDATELHRLAKWLGEQRALNLRDRLRPDRYALLDTIGMDWAPDGERAWKRAIARLDDYRRNHGNPNTMPNGYKSDDGFGLHDWLARTKRQVARGQLDVGKTQQLLDRGVRFPPRRRRT